MPSSFVNNFVKPINSASLNDNENSRNEILTAYAQSLDLTLHQALEAEREAEWWDDVEKSSWKVYFYLIQCKSNAAWIGCLYFSYRSPSFSTAQHVQNCRLNR